MRRMLWIAGMVWTAWAFAAEPTLSFKKQGQPLKTYSLGELKRMIPPRYYTVYEPHEDHDQEYLGFPFSELLKRMYGDDLKTGEELLFTCVDGYQPSIPVAKFARYPSYLVFERKGDEHFRLVNGFQNKEVVNLAPFYLVWDNLKSPELKADGAEGWPYQLVGVDLINFSDRFPNLAPPKNASPEAKRGFLVFRRKCATCHTMNGEGGDKAPELNYPASVTEYLKDAWLRKWIADPTSLRYNTTMPALGKENKDWKQDLDEVMAYLKAMAGNKRKPLK